MEGIQRDHFASPAIRERSADLPYRVPTSSRPVGLDFSNQVRLGCVFSGLDLACWAMGSRSEASIGSVLDARRVLVIDDDEDFADGVAAFLDDAGFEVRVGYSASEGLGLLDSFVPDVAIVDIRMPVIDGHALLAIFRAEPKLRSCTFVGISGHASDDLEENLFDHFFRKPFDTGAVLSALLPKH